MFLWRGGVNRTPLWLSPTTRARPSTRPTAHSISSKNSDVPQVVLDEEPGLIRREGHLGL